MSRAIVDDMTPAQVGAYMLAAVQEERDHYRRALEEIANEDYRGNDRSSRRIARQALASARKERP